MKMDEKEALLVIEEMIGTAKAEIKDNGLHYMIWGWLVFIAALTNYYLLVIADYEYHSIPWMVLMPLGGLFSVLMGIKERKKAPRVKTYIDQTILYIIQAFAISMFIVCFFMPAGEQWKAFYPTIMVIYSIWLYISGGILKFKPLMWGAALNWALAAAGYIFARTDIHLILIAVAVLGGYIIPGYLLSRKFNRDVQGA